MRFLRICGATLTSAVRLRFSGETGADGSVNCGISTLNPPGRMLKRSSGGAEEAGLRWFVLG